MAKIRNSSLNNVYDEGKEQILTTDDGKSYTIKNSSINNVYGDGKEKIIVENGSSGGLEDIIPWWVTVIITIACIIIQKVCF